LKRYFLTKRIVAVNKPPEDTAKINQSTHGGHPSKPEISKDNMLTLKARPTRKAAAKILARRGAHFSSHF